MLIRNQIGPCLFNLCIYLYRWLFDRRQFITPNTGEKPLQPPPSITEKLPIENGNSKMFAVAMKLCEMEQREGSSCKRAGL